MVLKEVRDAITSKTTRRVLLNFTLLAGSSLALLFLSILSTAIFFANYVPDKSLTWPVYLQYGIGVHPFGLTAVSRPLPKTQQGYDISVSLTLPKSVPNAQHGNFMVVLHLLDSDSSTILGGIQYPETGASLVDPESVIFSTRRPALVPQVDPAVGLVKRLLLLPYHLLVPSSQYYVMTVQLAEGVTFPREAKIPKSIYVEVQAGQQIQTYEASVTLTAKLRGLRWILHNYRLPAFITLTLGFWSVEMLFAAVALFLIGVAMGSSENPTDAVEGTEPDPHPEDKTSLELRSRTGTSAAKSSALSTPKQGHDSGEISRTRELRHRHLKAEAEEEEEEEPTKSSREREASQEAKIKREARETEELLKSLGEDTDDEVKIKVEDCSDS